jgi:glycerol-3-phosphate dehydrogenase
MSVVNAGKPAAGPRPTVGDGAARVASLDGQAFDAVVIGAGILGAGVARELARRGRRTLVVDRRDAGWGTTNRSTRLVHGGLRYLEHFDFPLVHEGLRERGWLLRATPRLVTPLGLLLPYYRESWFHRTQLRMGLTLYDILAPRKSLPRHRSVSRAKAVEMEPALSPDGLHSAGFYWDGQVELPERLIVEILRAAEGYGATVVTRCRAVSLQRSGGRVTGVMLATGAGMPLVGLDNATPAGSDRVVEVKAPLVINASGPWADGVLADLGVERRPILRLTQGVHLHYPIATRYAVAFEHPADRRLCFSIPWQGGTIIGTTDTDVDGGPENARSTVEEVRYVDEGARFLFPEAATARPTWTEVGVRSLMRREGSAGAVSRKHLLVDHAADGAGGLTTVAGGKLTAWRSIAADVVDFATGARDRTALDDVSLTGEPLPPARQRGVNDMTQGRLPAGTEARLDLLYGARRADVDAVRDTDPWWAAPLVAGGTAIRAEVANAAEHEWASTLADIVLRRMALGFDLGVAVEAGRAAGEVAEAALGWSHARVEADLADLERELVEHRVPPID